ncbi:unnamed protein product [Cylicocyclus nassatus]|uniref:Metalloendopeptidase n=1 Tax=Cylicocyclus nassatus TaxID=53992 RepID=A0AA36M9H3_CYLNA|nr:unnamed protein product [Cylicocyclus nassatus]
MVKKIKSERKYGVQILTPLQRQRYGKGNSPVRGTSRKRNSRNRWRNNVVPYMLSAQYSKEQKKTIRDSLAALERVSCFRFVDRGMELDFLMIAPLDGCYSYVGKIGGQQTLSLAVDCIADYIIWHEVMHALGFEHEHQRPDRDDFIKVEYRNVQAGQLANFEKLAPYEVDYNDSYDYKSIMHYDSHAFGRRDPSSNVRLATMIPLRKGINLIDNLQMSPADIRRLKELSNCKVSKGKSNENVIEKDSFSCEDRGRNCERLERDGFCSKSFYRKAMLKNCAATCRLCNEGIMNAPDERVTALKSEDKIESLPCEDKVLLTLL